MNDISFHTVDPESLKNITLEAILAPSNAAVDNATYDVPVPTEDQTLPQGIQKGRGGYRVVDDKLHRSKPNLIDQYRGRIGGCWGWEQSTPMTLMLLQVDFVDERPATEDKTFALTELAHTIAQTPGLIWKIWTENPDTHEAGGIYLFEDEVSLDAYLTMHTERLQRMGIGQINAKTFQVNEPLTAITRGIQE
jgi:hypothetical protein